jgi:hypothetical protein
MNIRSKKELVKQLQQKIIPQPKVFIYLIVSVALPVNSAL